MRWPGYEPLQLAAESGYLGHNHVSIVEFSSATQGARAFRNRVIDAVALTLDEVLLLAQNVPDLRIVLVLDVSNGGDVILGRPGIETIAHLRGRKVGYESTALGAFVLGRALELNGMVPKDVIPVSVSVDDHQRAFRAGEVDAVVTFEPVRSLLLAEGAQLLWDSSMIPGEIVDVLITRQEFVDSRQEDLAVLIRSWFQVLDGFRTRPDDFLPQLARQLALSPDAARLAYTGLVLGDASENQRQFISGKPLLHAAVKRLESSMRGSGLLREPLNFSQLIDSRPLEQAISSRKLRK